MKNKQERKKDYITGWLLLIFGAIITVVSLAGVVYALYMQIHLFVPDKSAWFFLCATPLAIGAKMTYVGYFYIKDNA